MNILLWILQGLAALLYGSSGVMKVFMLSKIREGVRSFDALPAGAWKGLGLLEIACVIGLIVPGLCHWQPGLTPVAASILAGESLVFVAVHAKYREKGTIVMCLVLGLLMAFLAYGRFVLRPLG